MQPDTTILIIHLQLCNLQLCNLHRHKWHRKVISVRSALPLAAGRSQEYLCEIKISLDDYGWIGMS